MKKMIKTIDELIPLFLWILFTMASLIEETQWCIVILLLIINENIEKGR